ncbi:hypothetical protein KW797_02870, partial [Candidatus Parcubacteria bacterium]|nr:hypothetical protein [Candidatus Parcubacteria bacterium]
MELQVPKLFEPRFLNLDYFFNLIYLFVLWVYQTVDHYLFGGILGSGYGSATSTPGIGGEGPAFTFTPAFSLLHSLLSFFAVIFLFVIIYCLVRLYEIREEDKDKIAAIIPLPPVEQPKNERWQVVQEHIDSANPAAWRLAILEADNMLDEMVRRMGYRGENLGERLKVVEPSDFESIQSAWEAHKVRNRVAHEGSEFPLSQREARRIIALS